jgi:acetyltransferase
MAVHIQRCSARRVAEQRKALVELLADAVNSGASVGFLSPLVPEEADVYWRSVEEALASGQRELLLAEADGVLVGTVQLSFATLPTARHRAEVLKLLVRTSARRKGVGTMLMREAEELAKSHGRTLLVLDTRDGDAGEPLYLGLGYVRVGRVPGYAKTEGGTFDATVFYYRMLEALPG